MCVYDLHLTESSLISLLHNDMYWTVIVILICFFLLHALQTNIMFTVNLHVNKLNLYIDVPTNMWTSGKSLGAIL